jgi:hypothetical protein
LEELMRKGFLLSVFLAAWLSPAGAGAADMLTGDQIRSLVSGNTVQGNMEAAGAYTEFYAEDGTIKGNGYTGAWNIDGDSMCFQYGSDPPRKATRCSGSRKARLTARAPWSRAIRTISSR